MRVEALHPDAGFDDPAASEQLKAINLAYQTLKTLEQGETGREPQRGTFGGVRATFVIFLSLPVVAVALTMAMGRLTSAIQRRDRRSGHGNSRRAEG